MNNNNKNVKEMGQDIKQGQNDQGYQNKTGMEKGATGSQEKSGQYKGTQDKTGNKKDDYNTEDIEKYASRSNENEENDYDDNDETDEE
jgi:hypothetical protein